MISVAFMENANHEEHLEEDYENPPLHYALLLTTLRSDLMAQIHSTKNERCDSPEHHQKMVRGIEVHDAATLRG